MTSPSHRAVILVTSNDEFWAIFISTSKLRGELRWAPFHTEEEELRLGGASVEGVGRFRREMELEKKNIEKISYDISILPIETNGKDHNSRHKHGNCSV